MQITGFEMNLFQIEACLLAGIRLGAEEVVGTSHDVVLTCLIEILIEVLVDEIFSFRRFDEDETNGLPVNIRIAQTAPVNHPLMMAHINTSHLEAVRADTLAIDGFPPKRERIDEEMNEDKNIRRHHQRNASNDTPKGYATQQRTLLLLASRRLSLRFRTRGCGACMALAGTRSSRVLARLPRCILYLLRLVQVGASWWIGRRPQWDRSTG